MSPYRADNSDITLSMTRPSAMLSFRFSRACVKPSSTPVTAGPASETA